MTTVRATLEQLYELDPELVRKVEKAFMGICFKNPKGFSFTWEWRLEKLESTVDYAVCGVRKETANLGPDQYREELYEIELSFEVHFELTRAYSWKEFRGATRKDHATITLRDLSTGNTLTVTTKSNDVLSRSAHSLFSERIRNHEKDLFARWEVSDEYRRVRDLEARLRSRALDKALADYGPLQGKGPEHKPEDD